jgi:hypothetical protein
MPGRILADGLHKDVANQRWWEMPWLLGPIVGIHFQTERWSPNLSFRFGFAEGGWGALGGEFPNVFLNPVAGFKLKLTSWLALGFDGGVLAIASNRKLQFKQDDPAPGYTRGGESYRGWEYGVVTFFGATINSSIVFYF